MVLNNGRKEDLKAISNILNHHTCFQKSIMVFSFEIKHLNIYFFLFWIRSSTLFSTILHFN